MQIQTESNSYVDARLAGILAGGEGAGGAPPPSPSLIVDTAYGDGSDKLNPPPEDTPLPGEGTGSTPPPPPGS